MLPTIKRYAPMACRGLHCSHRREDAIQEMHAVVWKWLTRLAERGTDGSRFPASLAYQAARFVRSHRRITGQERSKDVLSPLAQAKHGFKVESLPACVRRSHEELHGRGQRQLDAFEERLQDNTCTPPDEQAAFRIDLAAWLASHSRRDRSIIKAMARNERTMALARRYALSPSSISQKRQQYRRSWRQFCGDEVEVRQDNVR
jgi:hypothetical protein